MLTASQGFLLEDRKQNQWQYKERENKHPEQEVIHKLLIVEILPVTKTSRLCTMGWAQNVRMQSTPRVN